MVACAAPSRHRRLQSVLGEYCRWGALSSAVTSGATWHNTEAVLYAFRAIGRFIPTDEAAIIPQVCNPPQPRTIRCCTSNPTAPLRLHSAPSTGEPHAQSPESTRFGFVGFVAARRCSDHEESRQCRQHLCERCMVCRRSNSMSRLVTAAHTVLTGRPQCSPERCMLQLIAAVPHLPQHPKVAYTTTLLLGRSARPCLLPRTIANEYPRSTGVLNRFVCRGPVVRAPALRCLRLTNTMERFPRSIGSPSCAQERKALLCSSVCRLCSYADWLARNAAHLPAALAAIANGLLNEDVRSASALALKNLCEACAAQLVPQLENLFQATLPSLHATYNMQSTICSYRRSTDTRLRFARPPLQSAVDSAESHTLRCCCATLDRPNMH